MDFQDLTWHQARIAMQNEYEENLRLPTGMGSGLYGLGGNKNIMDPDVRKEECYEEMNENA